MNEQVFINSIYIILKTIKLHKHKNISDNLNKKLPIQIKEF
jgi:hypothetical protein